MLIPLRTDEPTRTLPIITVTLITINVAAFVVAFFYQSFAPVQYGSYLARKYGAIPYELTHGRDLPPPSPHSIYLSLLTYMFMHGGFVHLIGNMLFFNAFGPGMEDIMGHIKFLIFYLLCGVVAVVVYIIPNFNLKVPLVGASGAIAGVMGAHLRALPGTRILCLFFIFRVMLPAVVILFPWMLLQFANVMMREQSNVAFIAHIGGFIFGMFMVRKFEKRASVPSYVEF
jgi:membrane associated rhomboid family serine protease